ncbi:MAG: class I SAM-dependent methyltransferase [Anaeromyxobacter sp.]
MRLDLEALRPRLRGAARNVVARLPQLGELLRERDALRLERDALQAELGQLRARPGDGLQFVPAGHFYSALPSLAWVREHAEALYGPPPRTLPGVELREEAQLGLLEQLLPFYADQPFPAARHPGFRYWFDNPAYAWSDGLFLQAMLRHLRPRRVVEVGSGYSSCLTLDVRERYLGGAAAVGCTFVEPYPALLQELLRPGDAAEITVLPVPVQEAPLAVFEALEPNDVLFIDSTHVVKLGSDVNHLVFEVLPRLRPGVHVHVHDIFFPFEYPLQWVLEGRTWTEGYLLRAFLQFNRGFEVVLCNTFLQHFHHPWFQAHMPLALRNRGGHLWLRRTGSGG